MLSSWFCSFFLEINHRAAATAVETPERQGIMVRRSRKMYVRIVAVKAGRRRSCGFWS
jgi:hypothetical protein